MEKYKELYEERAAIMEFDGGLTREEAEKKALHEIKWIWIDKEGLDIKKLDTYNKVRIFERYIKS